MRRNLDDAVLVKAMRQRVLDEIQRRGAEHHITNNVYGSGHSGGQGVQAALGGEGGQGSADPRSDDEYFVDILRQNLDPEDPKKGWEKKVHRYVKKKVAE